MASLTDWLNAVSSDEEKVAVAKHLLKQPTIADLASLLRTLRDAGQQWAAFKHFCGLVSLKQEQLASLITLMGDEGYRTQALACFESKLAATSDAPAVCALIAKCFSDVGYRVQALKRYLPKLKSFVAADLRAAILIVDDDGYRAQLAKQLAQFVGPMTQKDVLDIVGMIGDPMYRAQALQALLPMATVMATVAKPAPMERKYPIAPSDAKPNAAKPNTKPTTPASPAAQICKVPVHIPVHKAPSTPLRDVQAVPDPMDTTTSGGPQKTKDDSKAVKDDSKTKKNDLKAVKNDPKPFPNPEDDLLRVLLYRGTDDARLAKFDEMLDSFVPTPDRCVDILAAFSTDDGRHRFVARVFALFGHVIGGADGLLSKELVAVLDMFTSDTGKRKLIAFAAHTIGVLQDPHTILGRFKHQPPPKDVYPLLGLAVPADWDSQRAKTYEAIDSEEEFDRMIAEREGIDILNYCGGATVGGINCGRTVVYANGRKWVNGRLVLTPDEQVDHKEWKLAKLKQRERITQSMAPRLTVPESDGPQEEVKDGQGDACCACQFFKATVYCIPCAHLSLCVSCCQKRVQKSDTTCPYCDVPFTGLLKPAKMLV